MLHLGTLRDLVRVYYTYRREAQLAFCAALVTLVVALLVVPPRYASEAKLLVKPGRESTVPLELSDRASITLQNPQRDYMIDEVELLRSPDLVGAVAARYMELIAPRPGSGFWGVVHDAAARLGAFFVNVVEEALVGLGIKDRLSPDARLAQALSRQFAVDYAKGSGLLQVSFTSRDPKLAQDTLDAWIDLYLRRRVPLFASDDVLAFFERQTQAAGEQLAGKEAAVAALQRKFGSFDIARREAELTRRLDDLTQQRAAAQRDYDSAVMKLREAQSRFAGLKEFVTKETVSAETPSHRDLETRLFNEMMGRLDQLRTYNPGSEPIRQIDVTIAQVRQWLSEQALVATQSETKEANPRRSELAKAIQEVGLHLVELTATLQTLDRQVKDLGAERDAVIAAGAQFAELSRGVETAKRIYLDDVHDLERARKDRMLDLSRISNVAVAERPTYNAARSFPPTLQLLIASPLLSGIFAAATLYVLVLSDRRIRDHQDFVAQLGLPLLAVIPDFAELETTDRTAAAEARAALHYLPPRLPRPNGRNQTLRIGFVGLDPDDGLQDFVDALRGVYDGRSGRDGLSDEREEGPADRGQVLLITSPPLRSGRESIEVLGNTDSIVFVVEWGRATVPRVRHAVELLRSMFGERLLGIVVNRKRMVIPTAVYRFLR